MDVWRIPVLTQGYWILVQGWMDYPTLQNTGDILGQKVQIGRNSHSLETGQPKFPKTKQNKNKQIRQNPPEEKRIKRTKGKSKKT